MTMQKLCLTLTTILLACLATGCMDMTVHVRVNDDGSGQIVANGFAIEPKPGVRERKVPLLNTVFESMRKQVAAQMGIDFENVYDRAKFERLAKRFGPGVRLKSGQAVKRVDGSNGFVAIYTVDDITQIKLGPRIAQDFMGNEDMELMDWHYQLKWRNDDEIKRLTVIPPRPVDRRQVLSGRESLGPLINMPGFLPFLESCLADAKLKMFFSFESEVTSTNGMYRHPTNKKLVVLTDVQAKALVNEFGLPRLLEIKTPADLVPIHVKKAKGVLLEHPTRSLIIELEQK